MRVVPELLSKLIAPPAEVFLALPSPERFGGNRQGQKRIKDLVLEQDGVTTSDPPPRLGAGGCPVAIPQDRRRRATRCGGARKSQIRRVHELAQVHVGQVECLADFIVAVPALVLRK
jgi:hypothetical protein